MCTFGADLNLEADLGLDNGVASCHFDTSEPPQLLPINASNATITATPDAILEDRDPVESLLDDEEASEWITSQHIETLEFAFEGAMYKISGVSFTSSNCCEVRDPVSAMILGKTDCDEDWTGANV